jgi:predicted nucleotidyltransferase component of viral defense system
MSANLPASVFARLKNWAKTNGQDLQYVLFRFANERILYRLSVSPDSNAFVLKGATMFLVWTGRTHRATKDIDLLGFGDPSPERLVALFREVAAVNCEEDGIVFDIESVESAPIREGLEYGGVRITMRGKLDKAALSVQVDIGFGDVVDPAPVEIELPTMLPLAAPRLRTYPREVVLAEKLQAMVNLGRENSRMKDFYDVWLLLRSGELGDELGQAIGATFARRRTPLPAALPDAMTDDFAGDPTKKTQWNAFLRRAMSEERPELGEVVAAIRSSLWPVLQAERGRALPLAMVERHLRGEEGEHAAGRAAAGLASFVGDDGRVWVERGVLRDRRHVMDEALAELTRSAQEMGFYDPPVGAGPRVA